MKKIVLVVLALMMCFSLCGCGGSGEAKKALVGQGKSMDEWDVIEFKQDGTGTWYDSPFEWGYDAAAKKYSMTALGMTVTFNIVEEDGIRSLTSLGMFSPWKYYHIDDIEKAAEKLGQAGE